MRKIIVTGGLGFIGSNLIELLIYKKFKVINLDKVTYSSNFYNTREYAKNANYKFIKCDINDKSKFSIPGSIAPMVVDAPFSNLDTTNTVNLSKLLVSSADQLIIMISSSAYNNGFAETMKSPEHKKQLKTIHYLKRDYSGSNEGATAEEKRKKETPIIIDDTVYQTSFYTKPIESSYVVKVK